MSTLTTTTILDGERNVVVQGLIQGDTGGEVTDGILVNLSDLSNSPTALKVKRVTWSTGSFSMNLQWDATTDVRFLEMQSNSTDVYDFGEWGGIPDTEATGFTGDILLTTAALADGQTGTCIIECTKRGTSNFAP